MEKIGNTPFSNKRSVASYLYFLVFLWITIGCQSNLHYKDGSDGASEVPFVYKKAQHFPYTDVEEFSTYLTMRDGVKIAVDYYLPKGLAPGEKIPAIIHQTRYWRSIGLRNFANLFLNQFSIQNELGLTKEKFIKHGYAWIDVDVRGSGASFGFRKSEWSEDEIKDGNEVVNWIIEQSWSNGKVGAFGVSYSGTSAEFLLTNNHPAIKAAVPMYTMFDVFSDVAFPGGTQLSGFTKDWGYINSLLDRNMLPEKVSWKGKLALTGVKPVKGQEKLLFQALMDHEDNWNVHEDASKINFRNEENSYNVTVDDFSIHTYFDLLNRSNVPVYAYSGWYDGGYARAAIRKFLNLEHPDKKLIIGPWNHGGEQNASPYAKGRIHEDHYDSGFDHFAEVLKFFDAHLKNEDNSLVIEKPVHYYTVGEEKWKAADEWPPKATKVDFYLSTGKQLVNEPRKTGGIDIYKIDTTAGTGPFSRWSSLLGGGMVIYPDRREEDKKLLCYDSDILQENMEVTGHPMVTLYIAANAGDCDIHVYLEEVHSNGRVTMVTEGNLRAINRKISNEAAPYIDVVPYRSFKKEDALPLVPGEITELSFDLLPVSYQFQKGSRIRIAIAGGDKDIFKRIPHSATKLKVFRTPKYASKIELPVVSGNLELIVANR